MKHIYLIGGPLGVGKTTVCQALKQTRSRSVFLDGDWCWDMNPFCVTEETKVMVLDNIVYILNNFLKCREFDYIIFGWVMHDQSIIDTLCNQLNTPECHVHTFSLICDERTLISQLQNDIDNRLRTPDSIERSIERLRSYHTLDTTKIDCTNLNPQVVAELIIRRSNV